MNWIAMITDIVQTMAIFYMVAWQIFHMRSHKHVLDASMAEALTDFFKMKIKRTALDNQILDKIKSLKRTHPWVTLGNVEKIEEALKLLDMTEESQKLEKMDS